jgi:hemerythrin-like domain-containing protein
VKQSGKRRKKRSADKDRSKQPDQIKPQGDGYMALQFLETLKKEHEDVQHILEELQNTSDGAVKTKEDLFRKLKQELIPHMKGEEKHFYPLLMKNKEIQEMGLEAVEEHHVAEIVLKELDALSKDAQNWKAKAKVFAELVNHHIQEEEEEVFPSAEKMFDDKQLEKAMSAYSSEAQQMKQKLK